jgi:hypothetical protein
MLVEALHEALDHCHELPGALLYEYTTVEEIMGYMEGQGLVQQLAKTAREQQGISSQDGADTARGEGLPLRTEGDAVARQSVDEVGQTYVCVVRIIE